MTILKNYFLGLSLPAKEDSFNAEYQQYSCVVDRTTFHVLSIFGIKSKRLDKTLKIYTMRCSYYGSFSTNVTSAYARLAVGGSKDILIFHTHE